MRPTGFARVVTENGSISEGNYKDGKRHGWCIIFIGNSNSFYVGWFRKGLREGNFLELDAENMTIKTSGWYKRDKKRGEVDIKEKKYKMPKYFSKLF